MSKILLTGRPGIGKTTLARKVVSRLPAEAGGFYTEEIRESGRRVGFSIATLDGQRGILAHVNHPGKQRVGKYGVNIEDLERIAVPALLRAVSSSRLVVMDELGRMELFSSVFQEAVRTVFDSDASILATIQDRSNAFLDAIRARSDVKLFRVTEQNRDSLAETLIKLLKLTVGC